MLAISVKKSMAEELRHELFKQQLVDKNYKIVEKGNKVEIPIVRELTNDEIGLIKKYNAMVVDQAKPIPRFQSLEPFKNIVRELEDSVEKPNFLPRKWELLGDVLILKIHPELENIEKKVAEVYAKELGAKTVVKETGKITGKFRKPLVKVIYGKNRETIHKENGINFKLNISNIMFSSGNIDERKRMAKISNSAEVVVDMFAGIGYFCIPMAFYSYPQKIYACEINPLAHHYLCENIQLNRIVDIITPLLGDSRTMAPKGVADRIIMGYTIETQNFLSCAMKILKKEGGVIHYHETCPNELLPKRPLVRVEKVANKLDKKISLLNFKNIKSYAPGISHVVLDIRVK